MIFLSHSTKDAGRLRRLAEELRERGLEVWFADIPFGAPIGVEMSRALERADLFLLAWSRAASESEHVKNELWAFYHAHPEPGPILFMRLDETAIDLLFRPRRYFRATDDAAHDAGVIADWAAGRPNPEIASDEREGKGDAGPQRAAPPGARHALHEYPRGPLVDLHWLPDSLVDTYTSLLGARTDALAVLNEAIRLRLEADADATYIRIGHLPSFDSGAYAFWQSAFYEACRHGPRMLAALLLAQPDEMFTHEARRDRAKLLERLRASRFGAR